MTWAMEYRVKEVQTIVAYAYLCMVKRHSSRRKVVETSPLFCNTSGVEVYSAVH
jgi:hypothetical protein